MRKSIPKDNIKQTNRSPIQETYRASDGDTLLVLIQNKSSRSRTAAKQLLSSRRVSVNGIPTTHVDTPLQANDLVTVHTGAMSPFSHPLIKIIWEDDDYVVLEKQTGIYTINTTHKDRENTMIWILSNHYKKIDPTCKLFMINRLDKETAGIIIMAKNIEAKDLMIKQWHKIVKAQTYVAVVEGSIEEKEQELITKSSSDKSGDKPKRYEKVSHCMIKQLKSSRYNGMHVIEAQMGGERIYSLRKIFGDNDLIILGDARYQSAFLFKGKIALEQTALELSHPKTKKPLTFTRPFPTHFFNYLKEDKEPIVETALTRRNNSRPTTSKRKERKELR